MFIDFTMCTLLSVSQLKYQKSRIKVAMFVVYDRQIIYALREHTRT